MLSDIKQHMIMRIRLKSNLKLIRNFMFSPVSRINSRPIFILGNQKSGTTVIAALLAEFTGLSVTLDMPGLWGDMCMRIHQGVISFEKIIRNNKFDFSRDIIKEPCLTFLYKEIKEHFPLARIITIIRDPRSNIRSILDRLRIDGCVYDLDACTRSQIPSAWLSILDGQWLGLQGENYIETLAARWNYSADIYLKNRDEIAVVRYEDFMKDKEDAIRELAKKLDLPQKNNISDKVDKEYQLRGNPNVAWRDFFGQMNLKRIEKICEWRMRKLGYG